MNILKSNNIINKIKLTEVDNLSSLNLFYNSHGLNRNNKTDYKKIIELLEKEMGILYSTEPNTIEDLEELVLTKLWIGLKK